MEAVLWQSAEHTEPKANVRLPEAKRETGLDDWVGAQEMIPFALRANLDVVDREVALASPDSLEVSIGHHASTSCGKPRSKDVVHFYDVCVMADRAFHVRWTSALTRVAHQL